MATCVTRLCLLCALLCGCSSPSLKVSSVEDLGALSLPAGHLLGRDGASCGLKDGRLLWTFGDTFSDTANSVDGSTVLSATGGWATTDAPLQLDEPVDAQGIPAQLIPYTDDELAQNRADSLNGWALWPGLPVDTGDAEMLLFFQRLKRVNGSGVDSLSLGTARIGVGDATATRDAAYLFDWGATPTTPSWGGGGISVVEGSVYLFACDSVGFLNFGCKAARAPVAQADQRSAYQFWNGKAWQPDETAATTFVDHVGGVISLSHNPYLKRYLIVTSLLSNSAQLHTADKIEGPWDGPTATIDPAASGLLVPPNSGDTDYLHLEHSELSSADGKQIVISYARPLGNFRGEVRLARITLQ
jgi:hypothetical protein